MINSDKQRVAAVAALRALGCGYSLRDDYISRPSSGARICTTENDAMHAALLRHAAVPAARAEDWPQEPDLKAIADALEGRETKR
jgi:hypothetical protein